MKIKKYITFLCFAFVAIFAVGIDDVIGWNAVTGDFSNGNGEVTPSIGLCPNCSLTIPVNTNDPVANVEYSRIVIRDSNGNAVSNFTICGTKNYHMECDIKTDEFSSAINNDGSTNTGYRSAIESYLSQVLKDKQLNTDTSEMDKATSNLIDGLKKVYCSDGDSDSDCQKKFQEAIAEEKYPDLETYPGILMRDNEWTYHEVDAYAQNGKTCEYFGELNGYKNNPQNSAVCAVWNACHAGRDSQSESDDVKKGDVGVCNADLESLLGPCVSSDPCDCTCKEECEENSDPNCYATCHQKLCPNIDTSEPNGCNLTCTDCDVTETMPSNSSSEGSCGQDFKGTYYSQGDNLCKWNDGTNIEGAYILKREDVSISMPGQPDSVWAGGGFNWGESVTETIVRTTSAFGKRTISRKLKKEKYNLQNINCQLNADDLDENDRESLEAQKTATVQRIADLNSCISTIDNYSSTTSTTVKSISASSLTMNLGDYSQNGNDVIGVAKNSCNLVFNSNVQQFEGNYISSSKTFFIPCNIPNNSSGTVSATYSRTEEESISVSCPISVNNEIYIPECTAKGCAGGLNIIYRPISLTNPFPSNRNTLGFWNSITSNIFINNNRGVKDYEVYNETPMYTITLTPSTIREIRQYNRANSFNDFNMNCENGLYCKSNFLSEFSIKFGIDSSNSCAYGLTSNNWYDCNNGEENGKASETLLFPLT